MSNLYRVACVFEQTWLIANLDHVTWSGNWRVKNSWELEFDPDDPVSTSPCSNVLFIITQRPFRNGAYINPAKELRPYITPKVQS